MIPVELLPVGRGGLLLEVADLDSVLALAAVLRRLVAAGDGVWARVTDVVPAARTVLLVVEEEDGPEGLGAAVRTVAASADTRPGPLPVGDRAAVELEVTYDGPDLAEVAGRTGLGVDEVVAAHTGSPWRVAFGGFAPGFAYLVGGDPRLAVPRRDRPRPSVPAGAVGLAGEFSGVYPRASPGGWQLLGTTRAVLWDPHRDPPALLTPGTTVRFVAAPPEPGHGAPRAPAPASAEDR